MASEPTDAETTTGDASPPQPPAGYDHVSDVTKPLESVHKNGHSYYAVFSDWVDMMLASLMGDEPTYQEAIAEYDAEELQLFTEAFAELQMAMLETQTEVLGDVYMLFGMSSDRLAQHFTPHPVASAMSQMGGVVEDDGDGPPRIADNAGCGSGRLLIWAARHREKVGTYHGIDKDALCAKMTTLNLAFFDLDGQVLRGDALSMDIQRGWRVSSGALGPEIRELDDDELAELVATDSSESE